MPDVDTALAPPVFADVQAAAARIRDHASRTPLLTSPALDAALGARVFIKPETLQRTGSFKFRGAYNALAQLSKAERDKGVIAFSSGNHAQGIAEAARLLGIKATIVMPADAPAVKAEGVRARGADLVAYDRDRQDREALAARLSAERGGAPIIPSFDHPHIIAGQGTAGLEIFEDLAAISVRADRLICCVGGGGLIGGINLAAEALSPQTQVFGAEPEGFDDHRRSLEAGVRMANARRSGSICDAILTATPGALTFAINQPRLSGVGVVADADVLAAMRFAFTHLKLVVEPGGAAALAAALAGAVEVKGSTVVIVLTGGNVDPAVFAQAIG